MSHQPHVYIYISGWQAGWMEPPKIELGQGGGGSAEGKRVAAYYIHSFAGTGSSLDNARLHGGWSFSLFLFGNLSIKTTAIWYPWWWWWWGGVFFVAKSWVDDKWSFRNKVFGSYKMRLRELQHSGFFL